MLFNIFVTSPKHIKYTPLIGVNEVCNMRHPAVKTVNVNVGYLVSLYAWYIVSHGACFTGVSNFFN